MNSIWRAIQNTKHRILMAALVFAALAASVQPMAAQKKNIKFNLFPHPKFLGCLGQGKEKPEAQVSIHRGPLADVLTITAKNIKPNLSFDMFTVQRSALLSDGSIDPNFTTFGLAWYQSDLQANREGKFTASIRTILLDQIFGFDPDVALTPVNTFHIGFWFNDPKAAKACGFDDTHPTPFNGEHSAGPVAMISVPDPDTNLGPLCTSPNSDGTCNP
jgi:hypothetical protein